MDPPAPGTPAYKAGLKAGDVIARIEGESIEEWEINEQVIPNLKGPKGTKVNITVERPGESEPIEFTVERDEIPLYTIKYSFEIRPSIGYVKIDKFSETTSEELDRSLEEFDEPSLKGLILDLRDNPGGALNQAIEVSDRFLKKGQEVVTTKNRQGKVNEYYAPRGRKYDYPMVVLINQNSASASEIVAGALQDHDRALIVGEPSFGKALVQTIYPLEGNRGLALTTGKYYTPSDRLIQRDYSGSFYDYYFNRADNRSDNGSRHFTDSGRIVFGGGGIAPDVEISLAQYARLGRIIDRRNLFFEFVTKLTTGQIKSNVRYKFSRTELSDLEPAERRQLINTIDISDETLEAFQRFLQEKNVSFTEEVFDENEEVLKNRLKQELFLSLFGQEEGFKVALEMDQQVQKALELFPRAQALLVSTHNQTLQ